MNKLITDIGVLHNNISEYDAAALSQSAEDKKQNNFIDSTVTVKHDGGLVQFHASENYRFHQLLDDACHYWQRITPDGKRYMQCVFKGEGSLFSSSCAGGFCLSVAVCVCFGEMRDYSCLSKYTVQVLPCVFARAGCRLLTCRTASASNGRTRGSCSPRYAPAQDKMRPAPQAYSSIRSVTTAIFAAKSELYFCLTVCTSSARRIQNLKN